MDGETLCAALQATLNPDRVTRQGAEAALQQVKWHESRQTVGLGGLTHPLSQVRGVPGFLAELLKTAASEGELPPLGCVALPEMRSDILCPTDWSRRTVAAVDPGVRLASAIYFKNLIRREWSSGGSASEQLFCEGECHRGDCHCASYS